MQDILLRKGFLLCWPCVAVAASKRSLASGGLSLCALCWDGFT